MGDILKLLAENPAASAGLVSDFIGKYKKAGASIASDLLGVWEDVVADDKHYELEAVGKWKLYQAYVAAGFDEGQAFALLLNNNAEIVKQVKDASKRVDRSIQKVKEK